MSTELALRERANDRCELCSATEGLMVEAVSPFSDDTPEHNVLVCPACAAAMKGEPNANPFGLQDSAWSEFPAVQVVSWRLLHNVSEPWAVELIEQIYFDDATREWAEQGLAPADDGVPTFDSNGTQIRTGDSVTLIKDLDVKGTSFVAKRGTLVRNIRTTDNPEHIEGRVNNVTIVLKTAFLKKA
ncbi:MAG: PhnA domain-containing protein [bacterium]